MTDERVVDELLAALLEAEQDKRVGMTTKELAAELGWSDERVRERLRDLKTAGRIEVVMVRRTILDGRLTVLPGYRMVIE